MRAKAIILNKHTTAAATTTLQKNQALQIFYSASFLGIKSPSLRENKLKCGAYARFHKFTVVSLIGKAFVEWLAISCPGLDSQDSEAISYPFHLSMAHTSESHFLHLQRSELLIALMISHMVNTFIMVINHQSRSVCWY